MNFKFIVFILLTINSYVFSGLDISFNRNHLISINHILQLHKISNITITYDFNQNKKKYITLKINIPI